MKKKSYLEYMKRSAAVFIPDVLTSWSRRFPHYNTQLGKHKSGTLFVPIVGERVDAHKFIPQVMEGKVPLPYLRESWRMLISHISR